MLSISASAAVKFWDTGQGQWGNAANWAPVGVPQPADDVWVGNLLGIADETVFMNQDVSVNQLTIMSGMGLQSSIHCCGEDILGHRLTVQGDTTIASGGRLVMWDVDPGVDFETNTLNVIGPNSRAILNNSSMRVHNSVHLINGGELRLNGGGTNFLPGIGTTLVNDGLIAKNAGIRTIAQTNGGLFDLDGVFNDGRINVGSTAGPAMLTLLGGGLTDSFSGEIQLGPHSHLQMQIAPWEADENSRIWAFDAGLNTVQRLSGAEVTLAGEVRTFFDAHFQILSQTILAPTVDVVVSSNSAIEFMPAWFNSITVQGGQYQVSSGARLEFNGTTAVQGGQFQTAATGRVLFNDETTWNGNVNIVGIARQIGDATVSGPTTINAAVLDLDGDGDTTWNISGNAVINAGSIDTDDGNVFTGTMNIQGGFVPRLTLNLDTPGDHWTMAGEMNLAGVAAAAFPIDRLAGSHVRITGDLNINHRVRIAADTTITENSNVTFTAPTTVLQMMGNTHVTRTVNFIGGGVLENGITGDMTLGDGVELIQVGLTNHGILRVGDSPGGATVNRFIQEDTGTWIVELGGYLEAAEYDVLTVATGSSTLDGLIEVDLLNLGGGVFLPEIGDEFTVLRSMAGVNGTFANNPVSFAAGHNFHWTVLYEEQFVKLRLDEIEYVIPEPSTISLTLLLVGCTTLRRRLR